MLHWFLETSRAGLVVCPSMVIFSLSGICLSLEYNQSCKEAVNNLWQDPLKTLGVSNLRCSFLISNDMPENKRSLQSDDLKSKSYLCSLAENIPHWPKSRYVSCHRRKNIISMFPETYHFLKDASFSTMSSTKQSHKISGKI